MLEVSFGFAVFATCVTILLAHYIGSRTVNQGAPKVNICRFPQTLSAFTSAFTIALVHMGIVGTQMLMRHIRTGSQRLGRLIFMYVPGFLWAFWVVQTVLTLKTCEESIGYWD